MNLTATKRLVAALLISASLSGSAIAQREFREYLPFEGYAGASSLPIDYSVPGELVVGRLMYPGGGRSWLRGGTKGDRTLAALLRRFTRIDVRSVEQPVNLDDGDDVYYWPFLMVGLAGNWNITEAQAQKLREYLLRGGFLYADSFFGSYDWARFAQLLNTVFPDRPIIEIPEEHPVFHIAAEAGEIKHTQIPHMGSWLGGGGGWLGDGHTPQWRGIEDDNGRLMVLVGHNNDTPDSWQWADDPRYPADRANLGLRIGLNIAVYMMTH